MRMIAILQPYISHTWKSLHYNTKKSHMLLTSTSCTLSKQACRFLTSLESTSPPGDHSATHRFIRKFVASSNKHVALNALAHLLSPNNTKPHLSSIAVPLYSIIAEASWFRWNTKLVADVVAFMCQHEQFNEAEILIAETIAKLGFREREICAFYCNLMDSHSKHQSKRGVIDSRECLRQLVSKSSSIYLKRRAFESMISGFCAVDLPLEAEILMEEQRDFGMKPSAFEFRSIIHAYGRVGLFEDLKRTVTRMEGQGIGLDTICSNMVLSSFGARNELLEMVLWLRRTRDIGVPLSIRTYNTVLNSCPTIMSMVGDPESVPLSMEELMQNLGGHEGVLVQELVGLGFAATVLDEAVEESSTLKLDMHGMHLGSAYLIILQWFDELRSRFLAKKSRHHLCHLPIPTNIELICGSGKHSSIRGESPVKKLVKKMMIRLQCPMKIDRKNIGCFIVKGKVFLDWLLL